MEEGREFSLCGGVELLINLLTGAFVSDLLGKNIKFNLLTCHFQKLTLSFFGCFLAVSYTHLTLPTSDLV